MTNDDGIHAVGLEALAAEFAGDAEIIRVAPLTEQSGVGHGISLSQGISAVDLTEELGHRAFAVSGTPADCMKLALTELVKDPVDFVVSGVNWGTNVGIDIHYSGTVAAAMEGAMFGIPSMAVSLTRSENASFPFAAKVARGVLNVISGINMSSDHVINVNVPGCPKEEIRGIRILPHSTSGYDEQFIQKSDSRGNNAYWLTGQVRIGESDRDTDIKMLDEGFITITPLQLDITGYRELDRIRSSGFVHILENMLFPGKELK